MPGAQAASTMSDARRSEGRPSPSRSIDVSSSAFDSPSPATPSPVPGPDLAVVNAERLSIVGAALAVFYQRIFGMPAKNIAEGLLVETGDMPLALMTRRVSPNKTRLA